MLQLLVVSIRYCFHFVNHSIASKLCYDNWLALPRKVFSVLLVSVNHFRICKTNGTLHYEWKTRMKKKTNHYTKCNSPKCIQIGTQFIRKWCTGSPFAAKSILIVTLKHWIIWNRWCSQLGIFSFCRHIQTMRFILCSQKIFNKCIIRTCCRR